MEAKDTYADDQVWLQNGFAVPSRAKQAEISFKAGMQEVVEWLERYKKIKVPKYQLQEWGIDVK